MIVKDLKWISKEGKEAEMIVTDGHYECLVFSHPCNFRIGDILSKPLEALFTENVMVSENEDLNFFKSSSDYYAYNCIAKVYDIERDLVCIGGIHIILDEKLPFGCKNGTVIEFSCSRLDAF